MDARQVFSDADVKQEFLGRFHELRDHAEARWGGLEGLEGGIALDDAVAVADEMAEGSYQPGTAPGLEAIIERFTRPVYLIQQSTFVAPADGFPESELIQSRLQQQRPAVNRVIPSAGRIELQNHRLDWVGTGWMVREGIAVTNRHVAQEFATANGEGFAFRRNFGAPPVRASLDWRREFGQSEESRFRVREVLWIEPEDSVDVAVLRIADEGEEGESPPPPIELMSRKDVEAAGVGSWIAVIGYPAQDSRNDAADQQRIFDGIYNVKRLAPGKVTAIVAEDLVHHDATTLGGNSGSVVLDLDSGKALGLHYGGIERLRNEAVQAPRIDAILQRVVD